MHFISIFEEKSYNMCYYNPIIQSKGVMTIMAKWCKKLLGLAAIGAAVAGLIYYFKKNDTCEDDEFSEDFEDEDFDLDSDLKPVSDREYVPLTPSAKDEEAPMEEQTAADNACQASKDEDEDDE